MKPTILALLLLACVASGQWFDGFVALPDSFKCVKYPEWLACDSATNTVWVCGRSGDCLLAIDSDSNRAVGIVRLPMAGSNLDWYLCGAAATHTLFCVVPGRDSIFVIDCSARAVVAVIPARDPGQLFYNQIDNKVYCSIADSKLLIIDAATNAVIKTLPVQHPAGGFTLDTKDDWVCSWDVGGFDIIDGAGDSIVVSFRLSAWGPRGTCYGARPDRMYTRGCQDTVLVIHRDTVFARIRVGLLPSAMCYNSINNKVYVACYDDGHLSVIRCDSNRVVKTLYIGGSPRTLAYDSSLNRVFCATGSGGIAIIDGAGDTIIGHSPGYVDDVFLLDQQRDRLYNPVGRQDSTGVQVTSAESGEPLAFIPTLGSEKPKTTCWNSLRDKVYVACQGDQSRLAVVDGSTNSILGWVRTGLSPSALAYYRPFDRVYCANNAEASVTVVDCATDSVIANVSVGIWPVALLCLPDAGKVYCVNNGSSTVSVIDVATNTVTQTIGTGGTAPCAIAYSSVSGKVYFLNSTSGTIGVIDQPSGNVIGNIRVKANPSGLAYSPTSDRLFCTHAWGDTAIAIDCRTDSVVARIYVTKQYDIGYYPDIDRAYLSKNRYVSGRPGDYYPGIAVVNCATLQVVSSFDLIGSPHGFSPGRLEFGYNSISRKMYCRADGGGVYIYPGTTAFGTQGFGGGFALNERENRMYAACADDSRVAVFRDVDGGVEEGPGPQTAARGPQAAIVRGVLFRTPAFSALLDISGRKVADLHPGANDVRHLSPGVYFVRQASGVERDASSVRKVIITR